MRPSHPIAIALVSCALLGAALPSVATAAESGVTVEAEVSPMTVTEAAAHLSHFSAGTVPVDDTSLTLILVLAEQGGRDEISLLRNLAEHERPMIRQAAIDAIARVRARQRDTQRLTYAEALPDWPDLGAEVAAMRARGLGPEEAATAAYARTLLGTHATSYPPATEGEPIALLASGRPRKALAALRNHLSDDTRMIEARVREDMGDLVGALRAYTLGAAAGDREAAKALGTYGVDAERLLLGVLSSGDLALASSDATLYGVLARTGGWRTAQVLSERAVRLSGGERNASIEALADMLRPTLRLVPLDPYARHLARRAVRVATAASSDLAHAVANDASDED